MTAWSEEAKARVWTPKARATTGERTSRVYTGMKRSEEAKARMRAHWSPERRAALAARNRTPEMREIVRATRRPFPELRGEGNSQWKGDAVTYHRLHNWVRKERGKASEYECAFCGGQAREWANISGQYRRDLTDFIALCKPCHMRFLTKHCATCSCPDDARRALEAGT